MNANLTPRQTQVLRLIADGKCDKEICRELGMAPGTVKIHLGAIYTKLGVRSRLKIPGTIVERAGLPPLSSLVREAA